MEFWIKVFQFLLSLSILIILHEFGHYLPAKLFKTRVEKFYLFFNPWLSLFRTKIVEGKRRWSWFSKESPKDWEIEPDTTEYGLGWLPLGGYVKISGMIDESMDKEQMKQEPQPWEFRSKPTWQRLIIMLGGVIVNMLLGIFIYAMVLFAYGDLVLPNKNLSDGVWVTNSIMKDIGFEDGDKIVSVRGEQVAYFGDIPEQLIYGGNVKVDRGSEIIDLEIPIDLAGRMSDNRSTLFYPRVPFIIKSVPDTSINASADLGFRDKVIEVNGNVILYRDQVTDILKENKGGSINVKIETQEGDTKSAMLSVSEKGFLEVSTISPKFEELERLGIYQFERREYSFFQSLPAGWNKAIDILTKYVRQFKLIFDIDSGAYKSLGGFGTIGGLFPGEWNWEVFWNLTALISIILAFMNVLPIPALDGGHVMFLMYEMVAGRPPSDKFLERAQMVGMLLLFALLIYANGNDIYRWLQGKL